MIHTSYDWNVKNIGSTGYIRKFHQDKKKTYTEIFRWRSCEGSDCDKLNGSLNIIELSLSEGYEYVKIDDLLYEISLGQENGMLLGYSVGASVGSY